LWGLLFQNGVTFWSAIELCYRWQIMASKSHVPFPRSWAIFKVVVKVLFLIIKAMGISSLRCFAFHYFHMLQAPWNIFCYNYFGQFVTRSQVTGWNPLEGFTKSSCGKLNLVARSRLPTLKRGRGSSWEPRD